VEIEGGDALGELLVGCADGDVLYLAGVGWLSTRHYAAYQGRSPQTGDPVPVPSKRLPFLSADPALTRALNGLPPPPGSFADERARYLDAMRPDGDEDPVAASLTVARPRWLDPLGEAIRRHLVEEGRAEVSAIGTFEVVEKPGRAGYDPDTGERIQIPARRVLRFRASPALKHRLASSS
jgi:DNA-binding protein HU-beta